MGERAVGLLPSSLDWGSLAHARVTITPTKAAPVVRTLGATLAVTQARVLERLAARLVMQRALVVEVEPLAACPLMGQRGPALAERAREGWPDPRAPMRRWTVPAGHHRQASSAAATVRHVRRGAREANRVLRAITVVVALRASSAWAPLNPAREWSLRAHKGRTALDRTVAQWQEKVRAFPTLCAWPDAARKPRAHLGSAYVPLMLTAVAWAPVASRARSLLRI